MTIINLQGGSAGSPIKLPRATLQNLKPGDTAVLAGSFDTISFLPATGITIDLTAAVITAPWIFNTLAGCTVKGGAFNSTLTFQGCSGSSLSGALFNSASLNVRNCSKVAIDLSTFNGLRAILFEYSDGCSANDCRMFDSPTDGVDVHSCTNLTLSLLQIGMRARGGATHPDGIQFWADPGKPNQNIAISGVTIIAPEGQGIYSSDGQIMNVNISDCQIITGYKQACGLQNSSGVAFSNLNLSTYPGTPHRPIMDFRNDDGTLGTPPALSNVTVNGAPALPSDVLLK